MKLYAPLLAVLLAGPAFAQTTTEGGVEADVNVGVDTGDSAGADARMEAELSSRVGTAFYSDTEMTTLRPVEEIKTQWMTISPEDQTALRDRCEALSNRASESEATSSGDGSIAGGVEGQGSVGGGTAADATVVGSTAAEINIFENDAHLRDICEAIKGL